MKLNIGFILEKITSDVNTQETCPGMVTTAVFVVTIGGKRRKREPAAHLQGNEEMKCVCAVGSVES